MTVLALMLLACTAGRGDSGAGGNPNPDGTVPVRSDQPQGAGQVDFMFGTYFVTRTGLGDKGATESDPSVFGAGFQASTWVPLPLNEETEACWRSHWIVIDTDLVEYGTELVVSFDDTDIVLVEDGRRYERVLSGDEAVAAATAGANVALNEQPSGYSVPAPADFTNLDEALQAIQEDAILDLEWSPDDASQGFVELRFENNGGDGIRCALNDDGEARIALGSVGGDVDVVHAGRVVRGTFVHKTLGNVLIDLDRRFEVKIR